jgi:hypothetical protein
MSEADPLLVCSPTGTKPRRHPKNCGIQMSTIAIYILPSIIQIPLAFRRHRRRCVVILGVIRCMERYTLTRKFFSVSPLHTRRIHPFTVETLADFLGRLKQCRLAELAIIDTTPTLTIIELDLASRSLVSPRLSQSICLKFHGDHFSTRRDSPIPGLSYLSRPSIHFFGEEGYIRANEALERDRNPVQGQARRGSRVIQHHVLRRR